MSSIAVAAMDKANHMTNPSGVHSRAGQAAAMSYEQAHASLLRCMTSEPECWTLVITSGASEGIVTALHNLPDKTVRLIGVPHPMVERSLKLLDIEEDETSSNLFITLVESLTGRISSIERGKFVIVDATQAVGKISLHEGDSSGIGTTDGTESLDIEEADVVVFSGHKFGGPKGIGGMMIKKTISTGWTPLIPGHQQGGLRGGTLSVISLVGMEAALARTRVNLFHRRRMTRASLQSLSTAITAMALPLVSIAPLDGTIGNTLLISLPICSSSMARQLSERGFDVGIGTACQAGVEVTEYQLRISLAMGDVVDTEGFAKAFRLSFRLLHTKVIERREALMGWC